MSLTTMLAGVLLIAQSAQSAQNPLPKPSGPHEIGRLSMHWTDTTRAELETLAPDDKRELMVHIFYPVNTAASQPRAVYVPDADIMRPGWTDEQIARIGAIRAYSREGVAALKGNASYPVILFAAGGGMKALTYHALIEDLASHGNVVVAIDGPYNARGVRFPDGRVLGNLAPTARGWPAPRNADESQRYYAERVAHMARDMSFVIDRLAELNRGRGAFGGRLDLARGVGVIGHSRGGQAAAAARVIDRRICGAVNLDGIAGGAAVQPIKGDSVGTQPFLWIQNPLPPPPSSEQLARARRTIAEYHQEISRMVAAWETQMKAIQGGAMRVVISSPGAEHIDFSDEVFWDSLRTPEVLSTKTRTVATTRAFVRAFFQGCHTSNWALMQRLVSEAGSNASEIAIHVARPFWK
jgi:pimeloyl-ACP methyl ester carboxylesterase